MLLRLNTDARSARRIVAAGVSPEELATVWASWRKTDYKEAIVSAAEKNNLPVPTASFFHSQESLNAPLDFEEPLRGGYSFERYW